MNEQNIKIVSERNFGFAIYFDPFDCSIQVFEKRGLNPSGQIWEQLVEKYCLEYDININDVEFDSESDEFVAYSKNKKELQKITQTLSDLIENEILLDDFLDQLSNDDLSSFQTPEVFISNLEMNLDAFAYTNHNLTINDPIEIEFQLGFQKHEDALKTCSITNKKGFKSYLGQDYENHPIIATKKIIPTIQNIQTEITFFLELAKKFNGKFESYIANFQQLSQLDKLDHWKRIE